MVQIVLHSNIRRYIPMQNERVTKLQRTEIDDRVYKKYIHVHIYTQRSRNRLPSEFIAVFVSACENYLDLTGCMGTSTDPINYYDISKQHNFSAIRLYSCKNYFNEYVNSVVLQQDKWLLSIFGLSCKCTRNQKIVCFKRW